MKKHIPTEFEIQQGLVFDEPDESVIEQEQAEQVAEQVIEQNDDKTVDKSEPTESEEQVESTEQVRSLSAEKPESEADDIVIQIKKKPSIWVDLGQFALLIASLIGVFCCIMLFNGAYFWGYLIYYSSRLFDFYI